MIEMMRGVWEAKGSQDLSPKPIARAAAQLGKAHPLANKVKSPPTLTVSGPLKDIAKRSWR